MVLDWMKKAAAQGRSRLAEEVGRFRNRETLEGIVAASAMIGFADGEVSSAEKQKMMGVLQASEELKVFRSDEVVSVFQGLAGKFEFDRSVGEMECLKLVGRLRGKPEAARLTVRVALIVAASDGQFDDSEKVAARRIIREVGLEPADFEL